MATLKDVLDYLANQKAPKELEQAVVTSEARWRLAETVGPIGFRKRRRAAASVIGSSCPVASANVSRPVANTVPNTPQRIMKTRARIKTFNRSFW
jgi:hypothetical protein